MSRFLLRKPVLLLIPLVLLAAGLACTLPMRPNPQPLPSIAEEGDALPAAAAPTQSQPEADATPQLLIAMDYDKMRLWNEGTQLRGANLWQRRVYPELDGTDFLGPGPYGPPVTQADMDALAALGANYVNLSISGLYTIEPPYQLDLDAQANLDALINMASQADLFVVITFRTGPGRSDFTFNRDELGTWLTPEYLIESVWEDTAAQDAWVEMWRYTAARYAGNPVVVGYDLMCEPNASEIVEIWDQEEFYADYAGTTWDWNVFYPRLLAAIRAVDTDTPVLIAAEGYSHLPWLPYLALTDDPRVVYTLHQYAPGQYAFQYPPVEITFPGTLDLDWDGTEDTFDQVWLEDYIGTAADYAAEHNLTLAINEFGANRWIPEVETFVGANIALFEQYGWNYAIWAWDPAWQPWTENVNALNFRFGPDPDNSADTTNALQDSLLESWSRNILRPSTFAKAK